MALKLSFWKALYYSLYQSIRELNGSNRKIFLGSSSAFRVPLPILEPIGFGANIVDTSGFYKMIILFDVVK